MAAVELNARALGSALAIVSTAAMLLLGILANLGFYTGAATMMTQWHMFFSLSVLGIISGMIEAAIISFAFGYASGTFYNKFA